MSRAGVQRDRRLWWWLTGHGDAYWIEILYQECCGRSGDTGTRGDWALGAKRAEEAGGCVGCEVRVEIGV